MNFFSGRSLAFRLFVLVGVSFLLAQIAMSVAFFYILKWDFQSDTQKFLTNEVNVLTNLLETYSPKSVALQQEIVLEPRSNGYKFMARLLNSDHQVLLQTSRFDYYLPANLVPMPANYPDNIRWSEKKHRRVYALLSAKVVGKDGKAYTVQVAYNVTRNHHMLSRLVTNLIIISASTLILTLFVVLLLIYFGLRPLQRVKKAIQSLDSKSLDRRLPLEGCVLELYPIVDAFNRLLDRIEEDFEKLKAFSANIAHELRTPINNLMVETEFLLTGQVSEQKRQDVLVSLMEEYRRIASIIDRLLFLARYDEREGKVTTEELDCLTEVNLVVDFHQALAERKNITVEVVGESRIAADRTLLRNALTNVLTNAIKYTDCGGQVTIAINPLANGAQIVVTDSGPGVPKNKLKYLTDKFYRVDTHRSSATGGSGLGLAIVKAIVLAHHGKLYFSNATPHGLMVTLIFPD